MPVGLLDIWCIFNKLVSYAHTKIDVYLSCTLHQHLRDASGYCLHTYRTCHSSSSACTWCTTYIDTPCNVFGGCQCFRKSITAEPKSEWSWYCDLRSSTPGCKGNKITNDNSSVISPIEIFDISKSVPWGVIGTEQATNHYINQWWPCIVTHVVSSMGRVYTYGCNRKHTTPSVTEKCLSIFRWGQFD